MVNSIRSKARVKNMTRLIRLSKEQMYALQQEKNAAEYELYTLLTAIDNIDQELKRESELLAKEIGKDIAVQEAYSRFYNHRKNKQKEIEAEVGKVKQKIAEIEEQIYKYMIEQKQYQQVAKEAKQILLLEESKQEIADLDEIGANMFEGLMNILPADIEVAD